MDTKRFRQALTTKRAELTARRADIVGEMHDEDTETARAFYAGALNTLAWVVEHLNTPEGEPLGPSVGPAKRTRKVR